MPEENSFEIFEFTDLSAPTAEEMMKDGNCYFCGTTRVNGRCPAYHPDDRDHLLNRKLIRTDCRPCRLNRLTWTGQIGDRAGRVVRLLTRMAVARGSIPFITIFLGTPGWMRFIHGMSWSKRRPLHS